MCCRSPVWPPLAARLFSARIILSRGASCAHCSCRTGPRSVGRRGKSWPLQRRCGAAQRRPLERAWRQGFACHQTRRSIRLRACAADARPPRASRRRSTPFSGRLPATRPRRRYGLRQRSSPRDVPRRTARTGPGTSWSRRPTATRSRPSTGVSSPASRSLPARRTAQRRAESAAGVAVHRGLPPLRVDPRHEVHLRPQDVVVTGGILKPTTCACAHRRQGGSLRSAPALRGWRPRHRLRAHSSRLALADDAHSYAPPTCCGRRPVQDDTLFSDH